MYLKCFFIHCLQLQLFCRLVIMYNVSCHCYCPNVLCNSDRSVVLASVFYIAAPNENSAIEINCGLNVTPYYSSKQSGHS